MADTILVISVISALSAFLTFVVNAYFNFWRGPIIHCSKIRYVTFGHLNNATCIYVPLVFTNIGSNTGVIEMVMIMLENLSDNLDILVYAPYIDKFNFKMIEIPGKLPEAARNPMHASSVAPKSSIIKDILFIIKRISDLRKACIN